MTIDDIQEFIRLSSAREENERKQKEAEEARVRVQKKRLLVTAGVVAAVLASAAVAFFQYSYKTLYVPRMFIRDLDIVKSDGSPENRVEALRRLVEYQKTLQKDIDLSTIQLKGQKPNGLDLRGLTTARALLLTQATLQNVNLQDAKLPSSSFIRSTVIGSNFEGADLRLARFDNSFIDSSSFSNADLFRATLNGAQFCRVDFSEAIVRYASFSDVTFEDEDPPNFDKSAWWLATGWDKHQRAVLTKQSSNKDPKETNSFKQELKLVDEMDTSNPPQRARALNERAWTLATFGSRSPRRGARRQTGTGNIPCQQPISTQRTGRTKRTRYSRLHSHAKRRVGRGGEIAFRSSGGEQPRRQHPFPLRSHSLDGRKRTTGPDLFNEITCTILFPGP